MMSSYIPRQPKRERDQIWIKLDRELLRKLELYGRFLESSHDYIIGTALDLVFRKDKAFTAWLETGESAGDADDSETVAHRSSNDKLRRSAGLGEKANSPNEGSAA
jgi:hypothetical protein